MGRVGEPNWIWLRHFFPLLLRSPLLAVCDGLESSSTKIQHVNRIQMIKGCRDTKFRCLGKKNQKKFKIFFSNQIALNVFAIWASENYLTRFRSKSFVFQWYSFLLSNHCLVSQASDRMRLVTQCSGCGSMLEILNAIQIAAIKKTIQNSQKLYFCF